MTPRPDEIDELAARRNGRKPEATPSYMLKAQRAGKWVLEAADDPTNDKASEVLCHEHFDRDLLSDIAFFAVVFVRMMDPEQRARLEEYYRP